jgi:RNA polymerase sigma factor (sigma-70 family)
MHTAIATDLETADAVQPTAQTDSLLLRRFVAGEEAAFSELVQRHSALVLQVCQRVLRESNDAEDAFQATFLVLARKAKSLLGHPSVVGWLHQTARRTALKHRSTKLRRREVESGATRESTVDTANPSQQASFREVAEILDAELGQIPEKFREVILLGQVEGLTRDEMAVRLGLTVAAVKDRLERGRELLRQRLLRRGVALTTATLAAWLIPATTQAASLSALAITTSQTASAFAAGTLATGTAPVVVPLAQGVLNMMGLEKLKCAAVWVATFLAAGGVALGVLRDDPTRFEKGLRGQVVAVQTGTPSTVTISVEEFGTLLSLDVAPEAEVWTAFEAGQFSDLKQGQFVSLRLAADHRTVSTIHVQGRMAEASIKAIAPSGKITIVEDDDEEAPPREIELAPDAILRIGGLPANRSDLKPGMSVPLEFARDGARVNAVEAAAEDKSLRWGELVSFDEKTGKLVLRGEDDNDQPIDSWFKVNADTILLLDDKPALPADLKPGLHLTLRLGDGDTIRALKATSPEPDDDAEEGVESL